MGPSENAEGYVDYFKQITVRLAERVELEGTARNSSVLRRYIECKGLFSSAQALPGIGKP